MSVHLTGMPVQNAPEYSYYQMIQDFLYFAFTKSIKTFMAIECLDQDEDIYYSEDILILLRSILDNYAISKYAIVTMESGNGEGVRNLAGDIVQSRTGLYLGCYIKDSHYYKDGKEIIGKSISANVIKSCDGESYFSKLYELLCLYAHCDMGIIDNYYYKGSFSYCEERDYLFTLFLVLFVFERYYRVIVLEGVDVDDYEGDELKHFKTAERKAVRVLKKTLNYLEKFYKHAGAKTQALYFARYLDTEPQFKTGERIRELLAGIRATFSKTGKQERCYG